MSYKYDVEDQVMARQVVTATAVSADCIDKQTAARDSSIGKRMCFAIYPYTDAGGTVVATSYQFEPIQADDIALTSNVQALGNGVTIAGSALKRGMEIEVPIPQGTMTKRYLGVRTTVTGGTSPTVTLDAYYMPQEVLAKFKPFPKVVNADIS